VKFITSLCIGVVLGSFLTFILLRLWAHSAMPSYIPKELNYAKLFQFQGIEISQENNACESQIGKTVGEVLASIFRANSNHYLNKINESCREDVCQISLNDCSPWRSDECGSTMLTFSFEANGGIDKDSFQCLQIP